MCLTIWISVQWVTVLTCIHFFVLTPCVGFVVMESKCILANSCELLWSVNLNSIHSWFPGNWCFIPFIVMLRTSVLAEGARVGSFLSFQVQSLGNANTFPVVNFMNVATCCIFGRALPIMWYVLYTHSLCRVVSY